VTSSTAMIVHLLFTNGVVVGPVTGFVGVFPVVMVVRCGVVGVDLVTEKIIFKTNFKKANFKAFSGGGYIGIRTI